jgi:hypothetical protein
MQENQTATHFLRSRLFTYDIMKNFNCISIKHRILATFNIKKDQFERLYAFKEIKINVKQIYLSLILFIDIYCVKKLTKQ